MSCPGCRREISTINSKCKHCGYTFKVYEEDYLINRIINSVDERGIFQVGDKVKIVQPEGVWNNEIGIIIENTHKYYKVRIIRSNKETTSVITVLHKETIKI